MQEKTYQQPIHTPCLINLTQGAHIKQLKGLCLYMKCWMMFAIVALTGLIYKNQNEHGISIIQSINPQSQTS